MRKTIDENGNVSYELTLGDRVHDFMWITVPVIIFLALIGLVGYFIYYGRYADAFITTGITSIWFLFFYMAWYGPRM